MAKEKILIVDDELEIRELINKYLLKENMITKMVDSGERALDQMEKEQFDLVILDIMMGGIDGFEVLRRIRTKNILQHVIFLSAKDQDYDKILGLGLGADDYVSKPFIPGELIARVKSQLRRLKATSIKEKKVVDIISSGRFKINLKSYEVFKDDKKINLTSREFKLFLFFITNPDQVFTKEQIYQQVWEDNYFDDNSMMVYIRHLRQKIEDKPNKPEYILTIWGIGYKFKADKESI